jgi:C-terminal peptidase prc
MAYAQKLGIKPFGLEQIAPRRLEVGRTSENTISLTPEGSETHAPRQRAPERSTKRRGSTRTTPTLAWTMRMRRILLPLVALLSLGTANAVEAQSARLRSPGSLPRATSGAADQAEVFMGALEAITQLAMTPPTDSALWVAALDGMVAALNDPYAEVFTPAEAEAFDEANTGNYAGIGIQITELNDRVTVTAVFRGYPADAAGMQVGDIVFAINDEDATAWTSSQVSDVVRGEPGTSVTVVIEREGYDEPLTFDIVRAQVHVETVKVDDMGDGLTYVFMDRFARGAAQEMDSLLDGRDASRGLIVDLRGNPGGYLDEALMLSDLFLSPGQKLAGTRSRVPGGDGEKADESWTDRVPARLPNVPMVVLVNGYSASASEILAGALQDHDRALIIGQRTFGKGLVQTVLNLPAGRRIRLTTGEWVTPLGRSLHRGRDAEGRPLPEDVDTFPTIVSQSGRELVAAGGIFPDLMLEDDTLTLAERDLLQGAVDARIPLPLRIAEFGFAEAQELMAQGGDPTLRADRFDVFVGKLIEEGLPSELLEAEGVLAYLRWRAEISVADRMDRLGAAAEIRMERDPVLREAVRLLEQVQSQTQLFAEAAAQASASETGTPEG